MGAKTHIISMEMACKEHDHPTYRLYALKLHHNHLLAQCFLRAKGKHTHSGGGDGGGSGGSSSGSGADADAGATDATAEVDQEKEV